MPHADKNEKQTLIHPSRIYFYLILFINVSLNTDINIYKQNKIFLLNIHHDGSKKNYYPK